MRKSGSGLYFGDGKNMDERSIELNFDNVYELIIE